MKLQKCVKCPKCGKNLRISNLDENKWICRGCNEMFFEKEINFKNTVYETLKKNMRWV